MFGDRCTRKDYDYERQRVARLSGLPGFSQAKPGRSYRLPEGRNLFHAAVNGCIYTDTCSLLARAHDDGDDIYALFG